MTFNVAHRRWPRGAADPAGPPRRRLRATTTIKRPTSAHPEQSGRRRDAADRRSSRKATAAARPLGRGRPLDLFAGGDHAALADRSACQHRAGLVLRHAERSGGIRRCNAVDRHHRVAADPDPDRLAANAPRLPVGPHAPTGKVGGQATHFVFYLLMLGLPLSGWSMVRQPTDQGAPTVLYGVIPGRPCLFRLDRTSVMTRKPSTTHERCWAGSPTPPSFCCRCGGAQTSHRPRRPVACCRSRGVHPHEPCCVCAIAALAPNRARRACDLDGGQGDVAPDFVTVSGRLPAGLRAGTRRSTDPERLRPPTWRHHRRHRRDRQRRSRRKL